MKRFNKTVTKEAMPIVLKIEALKKEVEELKETSRHNAYTWYNMKGKYGKKVADNYYDFHTCGYTVVYETEEDKATEDMERQNYYENNVSKLNARIKEIKTKEIPTLENKLCVMLWGFGVEEYSKMRRG